jgi:hypothetical protein
MLDASYRHRWPFGEGSVPRLEKSIMPQRHEVGMPFEPDGVNPRELCRRFGVSPTRSDRSVGVSAAFARLGPLGLLDSGGKTGKMPGDDASQYSG